ncbi:maleylpyruvate isomerase family mycothiol-dependent enzyme [Pedococcus bigeumensis]|uniref:Maleylpyruvate isomerase family mycothiol-dependent enzyme n=1 Tax=Pedococcus bigeumensis TaxID=433644 RepID=A0A502CYH0_9MICO|nr:maleylpyruvate isomerase family mycothiol-dependent enzyme [Pedococcus bigeumensis]TPG17873.1 maleylpyruvate isomerase family mycothiol-dependent enzyme [Pedococcus bigeumensis]
MNLDADLAAVTRHTELLLDHATRLGDVRAPSLCEGWSRAHVLSHVARNAEAIQRLAEWALVGEPREMYPGGAAARDAEIEAGALRVGPASADDQRPAGIFVDDLTDTAAALGPRLAELTGTLAVDEVEMRGGMKVPPQVLPFLRLRELVYHHVDLDDGFTFADVETELVHRFIDDAVSRLRLGSHPPDLDLQTDEGDRWQVGATAAPVHGSRAAMLLWLARRIDTGVSAEGGLPELPRGA